VEPVLNIQANVLLVCQETSSNLVVLIHAQLEPTVKTKLANIVLSNALLVLVLPTLVLPAQMVNTYSKPNVMPNVQSHWSMENVQTCVQLDTSLKLPTETVSNVVTNVNHAMDLLINVLHVLQESLQTAFVSHHAQPTP
jgi:hypothetical protein